MKAKDALQSRMTQMQASFSEVEEEKMKLSTETIRKRRRSSTRMKAKDALQSRMTQMQALFSEVEEEKMKLSTETIRKRRRSSTRGMPRHTRHRVEAPAPPPSTTPATPPATTPATTPTTTPTTTPATTTATVVVTATASILQSNSNHHNATVAATTKAYGEYDQGGSIVDSAKVIVEVKATTNADGECRSASRRSTVQGIGSGSNDRNDQSGSIVNSALFFKATVEVKATTKAYGECRSASRRSTVKGCGSGSNDRNDQGKKKARCNNDIAVGARSTDSQRDCPRQPGRWEGVRGQGTVGITSLANVPTPVLHHRTARTGTDRDPLRTLDSTAVRNRSNVEGEHRSGTKSCSIVDSKGRSGSNSSNVEGKCRSGPSSKARVEEVTAPSLKASVKVAATAAPSSKARVEVEPVASWLKASVVVVAEAAPSLKARDMPGLYYCNAIRFTTSPVEVAITPFCFAFSPSTVTVNH
jgi:hypothetical protein